MENHNRPRNTPQDVLEKTGVVEDALRDASQQIEEKVQELSLVRRVVDIAGHVPQLDVFYRRLLDILMEETSATNCSLMEIDPVDGTLVLRIARGREDDATSGQYPIASPTSFAPGQGIAGRVARSGQTLLIQDTAASRRFEVRNTGVPVGTLLCVPITFRGKVLGVVNVSHAEPHMFSQNSRNIMEIVCGLAGTIVGNARAHITNEQRFRSMFQGVSFAIIIIDPKNRKLIDCNRYARDCFGYAKDELLNIADVCELVPPDYREHLVSIIETAADSDVSEFFELPFQHKEGGVKPCEVNAGLANYFSREVIRLIVRDISEKKQLTQRMFQIEKLQSLGKLAGGVAHDFNNVLAAILGRVQLLRVRLHKQDRISACDLVKDLDVIEKASLDGSETVRRIQEFSRVKVERTYTATVDLNKIIDDVLEFTRVRWKDLMESQGKKIQVERHADGAAAVAGNAPELREVFINIINNAVDAMPGGGRLTITTRQDEGWASVCVEDSGAGIAKDIRSKIFDPFFTTKDIGSTGLGLSVSYGIISRHGGKILVSDARNQGTCFTVRLPAVQGATVEEQPGAPVCEPRTITVLVAEDEESVAETLQEMLTFSGHEVDVVFGGQEAVDRLREKHFDLVITDLGMPEVTGFDVAKAVQKHCLGTAVILMTGWKLDLTPEEMRDRGIRAVLTKPFQMREVLALMQQVVGSA